MQDKSKDELISLLERKQKTIDLMKVTFMSIIDFEGIIPTFAREQALYILNRVEEIEKAAN